MNPFAFIFESIAMLHMPDIGFSEILDIIILCTLIYYIMRWIRQTHAWALLKGIVIIVLVALVAFVFDLVTVIWVVQNALAMGLIALVILFQPELRKALEQLGRGVPFSGLDHKTSVVPDSIAEIVYAIVTMSKRKTGALICIEREVSLADVASTGIPIDAHVTRQLLMNVFTDMTPLHDGAVIIRNNRIAAAACILPLTSVEIDHELGTRHRAALGLSEESDALVIVVSEERGTVSAASRGKMVRRLNEDELEALLQAEIAVKKNQRFILRKSILRYRKKAKIDVPEVDDEEVDVLEAEKAKIDVTEIDVSEVDISEPEKSEG